MASRFVGRPRPPADRAVEGLSQLRPRPMVRTPPDPRARRDPRPAVSIRNGTVRPHVRGRAAPATAGGALPVAFVIQSGRLLESRRTLPRIRPCRRRLSSEPLTAVLDRTRRAFVGGVRTVATLDARDLR